MEGDSRGMVPIKHIGNDVKMVYYIKETNQRKNHQKTQKWIIEIGMIDHIKLFVIIIQCINIVIIQS